MSVEIANALGGAGRTASMPPRMSAGNRDSDEGDFARIMDSLPKPDAASVRAARSGKADDDADSDNDVSRDVDRAPVEAAAKDTQDRSEESLDKVQKIKKNKNKKPYNLEAKEPASVAVAVALTIAPPVLLEGAPVTDAGNKMAVQVAAPLVSAKPVAPPVAKSDPSLVTPQTSDGDSPADPAAAIATVQPVISHEESSADGPAVPVHIREAVKAALVEEQPGKAEKTPVEPKAVAVTHVSSKPIVDTPALQVSKEATAASDVAADALPRAGEATALIQLANDRPGMARRNAPPSDLTTNGKTIESRDIGEASVSVDAAPAADDGKRKPVLPAIAAKLSSFANLVRGNRETQDSAPAIMPAVVKSDLTIASDSSTKVDDLDSAPANSGIGQISNRTADATAALGGAAPSTTPAAVPPLGITQAAGVGMALGQQVVDMGISGRWIDDIAQQIATVAANPGQGSFQLASQTLGAVRVDIVPGTNGSDIRMSVENEAAHAALSNDRQRLLQDAQLASVRLGDVQIMRIASLADAQRGDMGNQNQGQGGANGQAAQSALSQNPQGQGGQQPRGDMGLNGQGAGGQGQSSAKAQQSRAVINDGATRRATSGGDGRAVSARYA